MSEPIDAFKNAFRIPELKKRILFTLFMLAIYALGRHVPAPGVNGAALANMMSRGGSLINFYDIFSGGAFSQATVFALGIMPYITASIILSLLVPVIPQLEQLQKQGQEGQKKITEYTRYGTIVLCIIQAAGTSFYLQGLGKDIVPNPGMGFVLLCIMTFTTGTAFIMWLGEQISENGVGNGMSIIIFTSIISRVPLALSKLFTMVFKTGQIDMFRAMILIFLLVAVIAGCIMVTTGQRRIPVQYPRQVKGRRVSGGQRTYLPLRVNQAGVIPIIFSSSLLQLPWTIGQAINIPFVEKWITYLFDPMNLPYAIIDVTLIIFFSFFYTAIVFNPVETADNMKKYGGVIIGVRPGKATADYLNRIMTRITMTGSVFLALVALMPTLVFLILKVQDYTIVQFFGGTSLLILVGVALDTTKQIEQHLIMRHYDGFGGLSGGRLRSRRKL